MRIVYMGTPEFAVPPLRALMDAGYDVVAAITQPDRPAGRGHKLTPCPVKLLAQERGVPVYQFEKIKTAEGVACPSPVSASEPYRCTTTRATRASSPCSASWFTKRAAARMGPMVCELEGPMPMENTSKKLKYMRMSCEVRRASGK